MATYNMNTATQSPYYHATNGRQALIGHLAATHIFANADVINVCYLNRNMKLADATVAFPQLDSNGAPLLAGVLEMIDGAVTTTLITVAAASLGAATGAILHLTNPLAYGYVVQTKDVGALVRFRFTAAPATGVAGGFYAGVDVTGLNYGAEDVTVPT